MEQLTENEQKLLGYLRKLIAAMTVHSLYANHMHDLNKWRYESFEALGFNLQWQDEMLKDLEESFDITFTKVDEKTGEQETDGDK